jgi:hypothetical protein
MLKQHRLSTTAATVARHGYVQLQFFVKGKSEVVRMDDKNNRRVVPYNAKTHAHDTVWRATAETHAWFQEEAELYRFSALAGLTDLQSALSKCLCPRYPVYVAEIVTFFKTLYTNDVFVSVVRVSEAVGECIADVWLLRCMNSLRRRARKIRCQSS